MAEKELEITPQTDPPATETEPTTTEPAQEPHKTGLWAGKFKTVEAQADGIVAIRSKLGMSEMTQEQVLAEYSDPTDAEVEYRRLQTELGRKAAEKVDEPTEPTETPDEPEEPAEADDVSNIITEAGLNPEDLQAQWQAEGKLTDEQYKALAKNGYSKVVVDAIAKGMAAEATLRDRATNDAVAKAMADVGGEEAYEKLAEWATKNLTPEEASWYNSQVSNGNETSMRAAITWLANRHSAATGDGLVIGAGPAGPEPVKDSEIPGLQRAALRGDKEAMRRLQTVNPATML